MVRVGIAGIGFMGVTHFKAYAKVEAAQVTAIFTRDAAKLAGDWTRVRGNFGDAGGTHDLSGVRCCDDLDALIGDPDVDLLDICLPSYLHREVGVRALEAGKHILIEKPIALTVEDADALLAAAARTGRLLMVAQVLRFWPEFAVIRDLVTSGEHGELLAANFKRVIARPDWSGDDWFSDPTKTGGAVVDLHIHDTDFVHYVFGPPTSVTSQGVVGPGGDLLHITTEYEYPGRNICLSAQSGALAPAAVPFEHGYDVYFERAMLKHNSSVGPSVDLYVAGCDERKAVVPRIGDAFVAQLETATRGVAEGRLPPELSGISARNSLAIVLAEAESARSGERVAVSLAG